MSMTVTRLHKLLGQLVDAGHGRKPVCVDKLSLYDPLEADGATIIDLVEVEGPRWICTMDDDGGTKWNKDGTEAGKRVVILRGGGQ